MDYSKKGVRRRLHYINPIMDKLGKKFLICLMCIALVSLLSAMVGVVCMGFGMAKGIIEDSPQISFIDVSPTGYKSTIYDVNGEVIQELYGTEANREYVTIDRIPEHLQHAIVAIEDERFYTHNGIDPKGIMRAAYIAVARHSLDQGASTITQQLIKNNVFKAFNESMNEKIRRKLQEQYMALKLEEQMSKSEILENYLNTINLGNGNYGVQAAAKNYFNKDVSELTIAESAVIVSITQRPVALNPVKHPEANKERMLEVLKKMYKQKYITKEQYEEAKAEDVYGHITNTHTANEAANVTTYSYFVDELIKQVKNDLIEQKGYTETQANNLIYKGGLTIKATQDMNIQRILDEEFANPDNFPDSQKVSLDYTLVVEELDGKVYNYTDQSVQYYFIKKTGNSQFSYIYNSIDDANAHVNEFKEAMLADGGKIISENIVYLPQPQASMTIVDQTNGQVKAIIGGRGEKTKSLTFSRATTSTRQPGSTFKIVSTYGPALDMGKITLNTKILDAPYQYKDGKQVMNHDKNYLGYVTVRFAIADSRNVPAVKVLNMISPQIGLNYALKFGFSTLVTPDEAINGHHDMVEALALGGLTYGVTNIDLCAAYAAIANKGVYNEPTYYTEVYDHDGNILLDDSYRESHRVIKESTAEILTDALLSVTEIGTGKFTYMNNQPVAGKTGTTNDDVDKWYVGYTPYYTGAIWFGYDDNQTYGFNYTLHVRLWGKIMNRIHEGLEHKDFEFTENITEVQICSESGLLPIPGLCDGHITTGRFVRGTEPTQSCDVHQKVRICTDSNQLATSSCPHTKETIINTHDYKDNPLTTCTLHAGSTTTTTKQSTETTTKASTETTKASTETTKASTETTKATDN